MFLIVYLYSFLVHRNETDLFVLILCSVTLGQPCFLVPGIFCFVFASFLFFEIFYINSPWGFHSKCTGVVCQFLLQWITFCQNSLLWPVCLGWPHAAGLIASFSYASPFTMARQRSMKGICGWHHSNCRKWIGTQEPFEEGQGGAWKSQFKIKY